MAPNGVKGHAVKAKLDSEEQPLLSRDDDSNDDSFDVGHGDGASFVSRENGDEDSIKSRARRKQRRDVVRYLSFACAILNCLCAGSITAYSLYGHLFLAQLRYTQLQVNAVSIAAELGMYLPVPLFGYLCDRYSPRPPSLLSGLFFGFGYILAAFTYHQGIPRAAGGTGWPFGVMVLSFVSIGMGTSCMYLSAVTTCAKNFGRGKHKGLALALPIAAFGLSGMWLSQVGSRLFYVRVTDGSRGDVDVYRFFLFLGVTLLVMGCIGSVALRIVDEDQLIDEAVEELERSGLLEDSAFFQRARAYGAIDDVSQQLSDTEAEQQRLETQSAKQHQDEQKKKTWLLNEETRRFLNDQTMWYLAGGFFLVTGPGESFLNNLGTIIDTLYPPHLTKPSNLSATNVSIVAAVSTLARIFTGTLSDLLAPTPVATHHLSASMSSVPTLSTFSKKSSISRIVFLITFGIIMSAGCILLASGFVQTHPAFFSLVSALIGAGYGAVFSLTPIICSVVWGVENFGTNWGIVAMVPAGGATVWGITYSWIYDWAAERQTRTVGPGEKGLCYGKQCYSSTFWAMAISVWCACGLWFWAWKGRNGWKSRGIAV